MKTDTQLMNELAVKSGYLKPMTEANSKALKKLLLAMYKDIAALCDKHGLEYMMSGGSCLGAVRHQGYIPWDDDLDVIMPRISYNKLVQLCKSGELGGNYEYDVPNQDRDCRNNYLKIFRRGTLDVELSNENTPGPKGVFIDIFPMDYAPKNILFRYIKAIISDFLNAACTSVLYSQYPSSKYKEFMSLNKESYKRFKFRMTIGKILGIIDHHQWVMWFDRFNASTKNTGFMTIPTGRNHYLKETLPSEVFLPSKKMLFEDIEANVPNDTDTYLKALYGDYMQIPPEEKRERHFVYKFELNINKY